jgi:asparagine synthase (glutamine-hydrolysing)
MVDAIRHRGPDDDGFFFADGVGLGMCRLSIIDVAGGRQPLCDESGNVVAMQNGEIYNYRELRSALVDKGHRFTTESDTEVITHLYEDRGLDFPASLNGMFAIVIFDKKRRRLVLARDRLGKKPLFVRVEPDRVAFASEMKSLLGEGGFRPTVDLSSLHDYLSFNFVPGPRTIFNGIRQVAPGATLVAEGGAVFETRYWELRAGPAKPWDDTGRRELRELFLDAVALRLRPRPSRSASTARSSMRRRVQARSGARSAYRCTPYALGTSSSRRGLRRSAMPNSRTGTHRSCRCSPSRVRPAGR